VSASRILTLCGQYEIISAVNGYLDRDLQYKSLATQIPSNVVTPG
jgi:hypothetical protein